MRRFLIFFLLFPFMAVGQDTLVVYCEDYEIYTILNDEQATLPVFYTEKQAVKKDSTMERFVLMQKVEKDFNNDGKKDILLLPENSFNATIFLKNGRTKKVYHFGFYDEVRTSDSYLIGTLDIPEEWLIGKDTSYIQTIENVFSRHIPKVAPDASLQVLLNAGKNRTMQDSNSAFTKIFLIEDNWIDSKKFIVRKDRRKQNDTVPWSFISRVTGEQLNNFYGGRIIGNKIVYTIKDPYSDEIYTDTVSSAAWICYRVWLHWPCFDGYPQYIRRPELLLTLPDSTEVLRTCHSIYLSKKNKIKWIFISSWPLASPMGDLRRETINAVYTLNELIFFEVSGFRNTIYAIDLKNNRMGEIRNPFNMNTNEITFSIKAGTFILHLFENSSMNTSISYDRLKADLNR